MSWPKFMIIIIFVLIHVQNHMANTNTTNGSSITSDIDHSDIVKKHLLFNYDIFARPNYNGPSTEVLFGLAVKNINLNEEKGIFSVHGWLRMTWFDPRLRWQPIKSGNLSKLNYDGHEIWEPRMMALNCISQNYFQNYADTLIVGTSEGYMIKVPPFTFKIYCDLDMKLWPFDTQKCQLKLTKWVTINNVNFKVESSYNNINIFGKNNEWNLKNISHGVGTDLDNNLEYITYDFVIQRRSSIYRALILIPAVCVIIMVLSCFWLPPQCSEKIILNGINSIIIAGLLICFLQLVSKLSQNTPLIVFFLISIFVLVTFSTVISVLVIHIATGKHQHRVPHSVRNLLNGIIGTILCLKFLNPSFAVELNDQGEQGIENKDLQENNGNLEEQQIIQHSSDSSSCINLKLIQHDWIILAAAIDRFFFYIYCIVFILLATIYRV